MAGVSNFGWKRQNGIEAELSGRGIFADSTYGNSTSEDRYLR